MNDVMKRRRSEEEIAIRGRYSDEINRLHDEIERLKAALKEAARRLIANGDGFGANEAMNAASTLADEQEKAGMKINTDPTTIDKVADLRAEIERLKGKHDERYCAWLQVQGEIERLRAAALPFAAHDWMGSEEKSIGVTLARLFPSGVRSTNARWRAALEEIAALDHKNCSAKDIARAALAGEQEKKK